jgi:hypothetical protein
MDQYPCPCCGRLVFEGDPGFDEICPVCFWQNDLVCLRWPQVAAGPNHVSLVDAQKNFEAIGASEGRLLQFVRPASPDQTVEPAWRPIDPSIDRFESAHQHVRDWPSDYSELYYWRPTYWRPVG